MLISGFAQNYKFSRLTEFDNGKVVKIVTTKNKNRWSIYATKFVIFSIKIIGNKYLFAYFCAYLGFLYLFHAYLKIFYAFLGAYFGCFSCLKVPALVIVNHAPALNCPRTELSPH